MVSKRTILIVDDEIGPRESLKMILKPFYNVETAEDGIKALEMIQQKQIDLVTLDLKMPGPHGGEVLKQIKQKNPDIEVLIITGYGSLKSAIDGIRHGACDYLIKPFNISEIINIINRALGKKKKMEELQDFLSEVGETFGLNTRLEDIKTYFKEHRERTKTIDSVSK
ncbi:MAG: response regulator [Nitrospirae bacterium]|nr:response regulator [Candidatus Manganitrophaceae bacterium]